MKKIIILGITASALIIITFFLIDYLNKDTLLIKASPAPFNISIAGKNYANKDSLKLKLKKGSYAILITKDGYANYETNAEMIPGKITEISATLRPLVLTKEVDIKNLGGEVIFPTLSKDKAYLQYLTYRGTQFVRNSFEGDKLELLTSQHFKNIEEAIWSPNKDKIIIRMLAEENIKTQIYDFNLQTLSSLDNNIKSLSWSPDGQKIAYVLNSNNSFSLYISAPDGSNPEKIIDLLNEVQIKWQVENKLFAFSDRSLLSIDVKSKKQETIEEGEIIGLETSPKKIAYVKVVDNSPELFVAAVDGKNKEPLKIASLKDKFVWFSDDSLLVASPYSISSDFRENAPTSDQFWLINTVDKSKSGLTSRGEDIDVSWILINNKQVSFVSKGRLYTFNSE